MCLLMCSAFIMKAPSWIDRINRVGEYYEGFVKNLDDLLAKHSVETVTTERMASREKLGDHDHR